MLYFKGGTSLFVATLSGLWQMFKTKMLRYYSKANLGVNNFFGTITRPRPYEYVYVL